MLKAYGYGDDTVTDRVFRSDALFVRRSGFMLLLFPVAWVFSAVLTARVATRRWVPRLVLLLGIAAVLYGIWRYVMLGFNAGYEF